MITTDIYNVLFDSRVAEILVKKSKNFKGSTILYTRFFLYFPPLQKTHIWSWGVRVKLNLIQQTDFRFLRGSYDAINKKYVPEVSYESAESHLTLQILKRGDVFLILVIIGAIIRS